MSIEITGVTIAHRKKTAAEWADSEYVLAGAEWGYETDTGKVKIGDGVTPWGGLDYFGGDVDLSGYATEAWVENKGYVSNAQIDTDADLAANSDSFIPSQKAVKAYVDNNAGGVTLKPWTPDVVKGAGIDLPKVNDLFGSSDPITLTGSTVRMERTGFPPEGVHLLNGLKSDRLTFGDTTTIYYKVRVSLEFATLLSPTYVGFANSAFGSWAIPNAFLSNGVLSLASIGDILGGGDITEFASPIEVPVNDDSEYCISYDKVLNKITFYVDGVEIASHAFTNDFGFDVVTGSVYVDVANYQGDPSTLTLWSETEFLSSPAYPIEGLPPLIIRAESKLDETAYPANATSNIFEITGTPTPLQWDELGGTVVNGDLVAFDSAGLPFVVDVTAPEEITAARVKQLYESNPDTNAFTDANVNKLANAADKTLPINWLEVSTSTFLIEPEHAGKTLWVTVDCVLTVTDHSTLPTGFNCEILKADASLIISVATSGSDTIRDGKSVIVSDASVFKSPSAGVIGLVGDAS